MLVIAPILMIFDYQIGLIILEILALGLAASIFVQPQFQRHLPRAMLVLLLVVFLLPLLHLIPLPLSFWQWLPGRAELAQAITQASAAEVQAMPLSLVPFLTEYAWLGLLPPLMVFLFVVGLPSDRIRTLCYVFLGMATFQALLGLMQYGAGPQSLLRFGGKMGSHSANGTYPNYDHLAGLLEMALPMALAILAASVGVAHDKRRHLRTVRQRLSFFLNKYVNISAIYGAIAIVLLLGLIFTQSRTGVMLAMLLIACSAVAFSRRLGGSNVFGTLGTYVAVGLSLALIVGLVPILNRFTLLDPLQDARWLIYQTTFEAILKYFPLGTGAGTFGQAYLEFHPLEIAGRFVNSAHNDYLEWIMEGGIVAVMLIIGFIYFYLRRWTQVWVGGHWSKFRSLQVGAGIGMLMLMLHGLVDFNLQIAANQIYFAFLAAVFFHQAHEKVHHKTVPAVTATPQEKTPAPIKVYPVQPGSNPFAD